MKYKIAETFVGAGGSFLGFKNLGFKAVYVNDIDTNFLKTLTYNNPELKKEAFVDNRPIEKVSASSIMKKTHLEVGELDVLFGGVVCKGHSLAGVRDPSDRRNTLYREQLRLVKGLRPKVSIIENVPAMANTLIPSSNLPKDVKERISFVWQKLEDFKGMRAELTKRGKDLTKEEEELYTKIKKEKKELEAVIKENSVSLIDDMISLYEKYGYRVYMKNLNAAWYGAYTKRIRLIIVAIRNDLKGDYHFPPIKYYSKDLGNSLNDIRIVSKPRKPKTVGDALKKLDLGGINNPETDIDNRPMSHNAKTIERFKYIPQGQNILSVMEKVPEYLRISKYYSRGNTMRLDPSKPSPTLVPGHSNFPVHPTEHRSITVREAATISGFPLDYKFFGSHTKRCEQVGNAVPIELAEAIADSIKKYLDRNLQ